MEFFVIAGVALGQCVDGLQGGVIPDAALHEVDNHIIGVFFGVEHVLEIGGAAEE